MIIAALISFKNIGRPVPGISEEGPYHNGIFADRDDVSKVIAVSSIAGC
jgi:hypothetical protein